VTPTIVLVRHADVAPEAGDPDPALTAAGKARAKELCHALGDAGIAAIFVTSLKRSQQTAAPIAAALALTPEIVDDSSAVVATVRKLPSSWAALVVGHTDTLPEICAGLGGPALPPIGLREFDHLFVLAGKRLTPLRYGQ
jgi:phosphohistidine phosphatase SixA